jgi:hypothetical protein
MPHQATITAKTGPDRQATAVVVTGVTEFKIAPDKKILSLIVDQGAAGGSNAREYDLTGVTTLTVTITSGNYAMVMS